MSLFAKSIPRIIHQIWHDGESPAAFERFTDSWISHHESFEYRFWDFEAGSRLIACRYPRLLETWYSLPKDVQRADLLRYVILHRYGGVYADMDTEALRPLNPILVEADFVAGYEAKSYPSICNAILAATPRHPILCAMLRYLTSVRDGTAAGAEDVSHVFATTGSLALTPIILANRTERTRILPPSAFYPFSWAEKEKHDDQYPDAYTKHYWVSGWYDEGNYTVLDYWNVPCAYEGLGVRGFSALSHTHTPYEASKRLQSNPRANT